MTLACAHRGDSSRYRENTITAITSAIESGADVVEIDVRLTSDGTVVVLHDPTLERMWGDESPVNQRTWNHVKELGSADLRIPLLSDVLPLFVGTQSVLMIDMEQADPAASAMAVVMDGPLSQEQITWCGDLNGMKIIRSLSSEARIWLPWNEVGTPTQALLDEVKPEFINLNYSYIDKKVVETFHSMGYKVSAWTIDDLPTMRWAVAIGIDSITTNQLAALQSVIKERPSLDTAGKKSIPLADLDIDYAMVVARSIASWAQMVMRHVDPGSMMLKKNAADIVTAFDLLIENHAREVIAANFVGHSFVGEEFGGEHQRDVPEWYMDPIDGTTNFANRLPWNSHSIALAYNQKPLLGLVAHPWIDRLYEAQIDKGAKCNGEPLVINDLAGDNPLQSRVVSTELAAYQPWPGMLNMLDLLAQEFCTMRIMGSGTLTLTGVADNQSVGSVIGHYSPIDHLAAVIIVHEAGGVVLDEDGNENLFPLKGGILCATKSAARPLYEIWKKSIL